eukprot:TRINITY_DN27836_c0_g1_i1.p1 TRINITY_DN27836_c0_g1~~TRINITY_DN27836_c0_g1_i1.p1  ORF type:complete len:214 (-),score=56.39 TRINITY_DN27836_c0_g1_i1:57-698(-)
MIRRPPRSTLSSSSAASDVYKRQVLEWNTADNAMESSWHVVDLVEGSPADRCGDVMAQRDYLLGMEASDRSLVLFGPHSSSSDLRDMVASSLSHGEDVLVLLVFDSVNNAIKEVTIPMCGINTMGIDVADGYLHFIPAVISNDPLDMIRKLPCVTQFQRRDEAVSYTHLRAHETPEHLVCRLLLEKKKKLIKKKNIKNKKNIKKIRKKQYKKN